MRKLPVIFAVSALALTLAGCAGSPSPSSTPDGGATAAPQAEAGSCTETPSGDASDSVEVTGDAGSIASATFDSPVDIDATERTVLSEGDGEKANIGDFGILNFTLFNGTSGDEVFSTYDEGSASLSMVVDATQFLPGLVKGVECLTGGSRIAVAVPASEGFAEAGNPALGIAATDPLVFVVDLGQVLSVSDPDQLKANGAVQPVVDGVPTVADAEDGTPTVTIPDTAPPAELTITVLKKGDGKVVEAGQPSVVQYQGSVWGTKTVFDQSWGKTPFAVQPGGTVEGFEAAISGQTVGSQVIVSIPPAQGYGDAGQPDAGISGTDTLVFVIDILAG
ncbi:FKBP-type peptidyl-prolyl cis-trans isomerase [Agreia sp.]|uniref:FKBP-type peptidyl-prolyl cis-trans isomerase n=1 Tax=Agreia sp. TaxID=1872416 RepID=UPI0035BBD8DB